jgi:catechol 2,3-dioxygenase-like lactoylglutathione lyase family enzyme
MISGVDFVQVPCQDLARARDFYEHVLGLAPSLVYQRGDTPAVGAEFENGTVTLALIDCARLGMAFRPNAAAIAFRVDDFDAARAELAAKGVESATRSTAASA